MEFLKETLKNEKKSNIDVNNNSGEVRHLSGNICKLFGDTRIRIDRYGDTFCFCKVKIKHGKFKNKNININVYVDNLDTIIKEGDCVNIKIDKDEDGAIRAIGYLDPDNINVEELEYLFEPSNFSKREG